MKPNAHMLPSGRYVGCEGLVIADDPRNITLVATLALAVPLWMWDLRDRSDRQRAAIASRCGGIVAEKGDILQFGSKKKGTAAEVFNALAEGIAAAAFQPGGITFAGRHWCVNHVQCEEAADYAAKITSSGDVAPSVASNPRSITNVELTDSTREAL